MNEGGNAEFLEGLSLVPVFNGDTSLAKYLFHQTSADIADMRIGNPDFLGSFDHELVLCA